MRTFHIGGAATRASEQNTQESKGAGLIKYIGINTVKNATGENIVMNRNGIIAIVDEKGREKAVLGGKAICKHLAGPTP